MTKLFQLVHDRARTRALISAVFMLLPLLEEAVKMSWI